MAALVKDRTNRQPIVDVAKRIDASQADEMKFMRKWLSDRGQTAPNPAAGDMMHMQHAMPAIPRRPRCGAILRPWEWRRPSR